MPKVRSNGYELKAVYPIGSLLALVGISEEEFRKAEKKAKSRGQKKNDRMAQYNLRRGEKSTNRALPVLSLQEVLPEEHGLRGSLPAQPRSEAGPKVRSEQRSVQLHELQQKRQPSKKAQKYATIGESLTEDQLGFGKFKRAYRAKNASTVICPCGKPKHLQQEFCLSCTTRRRRAGLHL